MFTKGRFVGAYIDKPTVVTANGLKVGNREDSAVKILRTDPTYDRWKAEQGITNITIGKAKLVGKPGSSKMWDGNLLRLSSRKGIVVQILAGTADYVTLRDYCAE